MAAFPDLNNIYVPSQARVDAQLQQREANKLAILARQDQIARGRAADQAGQAEAARIGRVRNAFAAHASDPSAQAAAVAGDDPDLSFKLMEHVRQLDAGERDRQVKEAGLVAQAFSNLPDDPAAYAQTVQALRMAGVDKPFPEYQPGIVQAMARLSGATVKAGALVAAEDPQGNPVFIQQTGQGVRQVPGYRPPTKAEAAPKPMSRTGKLAYDLKQGFIDPTQYEQGVKAMNKPLVDLSTGSDELQKADVKTIGAMTEQFQKLRGLSADLDRVEAALGRFETGPAAPAKLLLLQVANMLGVEGVSQEAAEGEIIRSIQSRLAPAIRATGSGQSSDRDVQMFLNSLPNLMNTAEGNRQVINHLRKIVAHKGRELRFTREYFVRNGNSLTGLDDAMTDAGLGQIFDDAERQSLMRRAGGRQAPRGGNTTNPASMSDDELLRALGAGGGT